MFARDPRRDVQGELAVIRAGGRVAGRTRFQSIAAVAGLSLMIAQTTAGQLRPCPAIASVNDLKVVLDEVYFDPAGRMVSGFPIERLTVKLQSQLNALRTDMGVVT